MDRKRRSFLVGAGCSAWLGAAAGAPAAAVLVLTSGAEAPWSTADGKGFLNLLVPELFGRLGRRAEVQMFTSSERALLNADQGVDDGIAMRIAGLEQRYANLVPVAEPVAMNDFVALSARRDIRVGGWEALSAFSVGFVNGWKIFEARLAEGPNVLKLRDADQLFSLLAERRLDVGLHERWQGVHKTLQHGLKVLTHDPPLARVPMHAYLHHRHAALAPRLAAALAAMKRDGSYERLWEATVGALRRAAQ